MGAISSSVNLLSDMESLSRAGTSAPAASLIAPCAGCHGGLGLDQLPQSRPYRVADQLLGVLGCVAQRIGLCAGAFDIRGSVPRWGYVGLL